MGGFPIIFQKASCISTVGIQDPIEEAVVLRREPVIERNLPRIVLWLRGVRVIPTSILANDHRLIGCTRYEPNGGFPYWWHVVGEVGIIEVGHHEHTRAVNMRRVHEASHVG